MTVVNEVRSRGTVNTSVRVALLGALTAAALWSAVDAAGASIAIASRAFRGEIATTLSSDAPVAHAQAGGPLVSAVYNSARVEVTGAPAGVQVVAAVADSAAVMTHLALGVALVLLITSVLRRMPFSEGTALQITICGGAAMISALAALGTGALADWMTADFLNMSGAGRWPIEAAVDPSLIPLGFALMVVGLLISHGAQLQHATDGLV